MKFFPKGMFFDWDGTLADSFAFLEGAHNHVRMQLGHPSFREGEFEHYFGKPREELYRIIYAPHEAEAKKLFEAYVRENHLKLQPMPGAQELLAFLKQQGIVCGVVSNKKPEFIEAEIKNFGWEPYFVTFVGAGEAKADKPAGDPLLLALERAGGMDPMDIWYIGDTDNDIECAQAIGCKAVLLAHLPDAPRWIERYRPDFVLRDCFDFQAFLLQSSNK